MFSKSRKILSQILTFWIPIKSYRKALRGILLIGISKYKNIIKTDKTKKFSNELAITAIMKNEGPYLKEWLDFHILVGVTKFYLYDNESTDNTAEILKPYIKQGIVDYTYWPGKIQQVPSYNDSIKKHSLETRWMAFIDLDEFLVPVNHTTITDYLKTLPTNFAQLVIGWIIYGSSGHKEKQNGLIIENYKKHASKNWGVKSIVNPRLTYSVTNPHVHKVAGFTIDENGKKLGRIIQTEKRNITTNKIRCNHYVTKSLEEYTARQKRGSAAQAVTNHRSMEKFKMYDKNEIYDDIMDKYIEKLKKISD